ncbi:acyl-CoA thioester hydrolase [Sphingobium sp. B2D3A]|uniref:acyl-CoA thioesterase n=1 Tax=unclassified Sphingobium TaxID=2611147 RepID=UPI0022252A5F|nr:MULTISPECIES: acyl-CoA thioesterase [unclassified Sphingobium]MCW2336826.1 acyl-CoA thioester hydrolase [Sphingobium sp. B2D3A]MCW2386580.1 acyl-CoA thioester hydrolase [Sphingobium sp. B2D3D]
MGKAFEQHFTAGPDDIDIMGHVNNAVWVRWMEQLATAHWESLAPPEAQARYVWVVTRHEIDYRGNVTQGETVLARTWIEEPPRGARFDRLIAFTGVDRAPKVNARTTWAMIDKETGRLARVPADLAKIFLA